MKNKKKTVVGAFLLIVSIICLLILAIYSIILSFRYPDMTNIRRMLEFPVLFWGTIPCVVAFFIGRYLVEFKE